MSSADAFNLDLARIRALEVALASAVEGRIAGQWRPLRDPRRLPREDWPLLTVPARHPGFGDLAVHLHCDEGFVVYLGRFTHAHLDRFTEPDPDALAKQVVELLQRVLRDELVCYQLWRGGSSRPRTEREGWLTRLFRKGPQWVWSGPLEGR